jgi:hypothetical protein
VASFIQLATSASRSQSLKMPKSAIAISGTAVYSHHLRFRLTGVSAIDCPGAMKARPALSRGELHDSTADHANTSSGVQGTLCRRLA